MKGEFWIRHLGQEEKYNFLNNLTSFRGDASRYYLENEYGDFYKFIAGAFSWDNTPEGFDYWFQVYTQVYRIKTVKYKMDKFKFV